MGYEIAGRIKEERTRLGWEQHELSQRLAGAVTQQTVSRWEKAGSRPRRDMVIKLAALFEIDSRELLEAAGYEFEAHGAGMVPSHPVRPKVTVLPLGELAPDKLEELVAELAQAVHVDDEVHRFGGRGHKQHGVDVVVKAGSKYRVAYQVKRVKEFGPKDVDDAVKAVTLVAGRYFLVLSRSPASTGAREAIQKHEGWDLWDANDVSLKIRTLPHEAGVRIVNTYFENYTDDFFGNTEASPWLPEGEFFKVPAVDPIFTQQWSLVGRQEVLKDVSTFISNDERRVGLVIGRGGIGKSRLLREVALNTAGDGTTTRFLKLRSEVRPADFKHLPRDGRVLAVIDDAHDRDDLIGLVADLLRHNPELKVLLALRPYMLSSVENDLGRIGLMPEEVAEFILEDLDHKEATELAVQALGPGFTATLAKSLGELTADCPFVTVVAGVLIRRGDLDPGCIAQAGDLRSMVLDRFTDVVVANPGGGEDDLRRKVLYALSALQPFRSSDPAFQNSLSSIVGAPYDMAFRHIRDLEDAGVLMRRGDSRRIVPDLLGDAVLVKASFDERTGASTRFIERAWESAEGAAVQNVFVNASRIDWQLHQDLKSSQRLTDSLWASVREVAASAGIQGRVAILKLVQKVSYFEPGEAVDLVRWLIEHPGDSPKDDLDESSASMGSLTNDDVLHEMPAALRGATYSFEYLRPAAELLWMLAKNDGRDVLRTPDHPIRVLSQLAAVYPGKPLGYNTVMIDLAEGWMQGYDAATSEHSPFDVVTPILATQGTVDSMEGYSITMTGFLVQPDAVKPLRERVLELARTEIASSDLRRAARAVKVVEDALRYPIGMYGGEVETEKREKWTPIFLDELRCLEEVVTAIEVDPAVAVALRRALMWHLDYSPHDTRDAARQVVEALGDSLGVQVAQALFDGWRHLLGGRTRDFQQAEDDKQDEMKSLAGDLCSEFNDSELIELLGERLAAQEEVLGEGRGSGGRFIWVLVHKRPALGVAICEAVLRGEADTLMDLAGVVLAVLAETLPDQVISLADRFLATGDQKAARCVGVAFGWNRGLRTTLVPGELDLLSRLACAKDPSLRQSVIVAARRIAAHDLPDARRLICAVPFDDSADVADELMGVLSGQSEIRWDDLGEPEKARLLDQLERCPSLGSYWVEGFLSNLSETSPISVVRLLMRRIEAGEPSPSSGDFEPLPFQWSQPLRVQLHSDHLRVLEDLFFWLTRGVKSWFRQYEGSRLFADVAGGFGEDVLAEIERWLHSASSEQVAVISSILGHIPRSVVLEDVDFVCRVLRAAARLGNETVERMEAEMRAAVTNGVFTGAPGQPFPQDVELRDRASRISETLPRGSVEERFYRSLVESANQRIRWHQDLDLVHSDGRDW